MFKYRLSRHQQRYVRVFFFLFLLIAGAAVLILHYRNYQRTQLLLEQQTQTGQLIIARSGAKSIEVFMRNLATHMKTLSEVESVAFLDIPKTRQLYGVLLEQYETTPVTTMMRVDQDGKSVVVADRLGITFGEGNDFSDRAYFQWAKDPSHRGMTYISDPLISRAGSVKGKQIVVVVAPTYYHDKFTGVVGIEVTIEPLTKVFISSLRTTTTGEELLVSQNGTVIVGEPLDSHIVFIEEEQQRLVATSDWIRQALVHKEGTASVILRPSHQQERVLLSYHDVDISGNQWLLLTTTSSVVLTQTLFPAYTDQIYSFILSGCTLLVGGILFITIEHLAHKNGFLLGYEDGIRETESKNKTKHD